jgi:tRNA 2-selenouridine synthase
VMERMRAAPCIDLQLARPARVRLLMEDYQHFCADPSVLADQLTHLTLVHGRAKIADWQAMAQGGALPALVDELLVQHYDPAYLRSIDRNFVQYPQAQMVELADIGTSDFLAAARHLHDAPA